ncbi:MAG TPA: prepilin-type N-terminal cleavage/methylation domain-containing protein [Polyangiaceae bacterium]|jgi:prepilin-type N-terminal cleavage/methylation domain-containing protein|nr:prepilin-type N-terminal cleavage/methylation domain-containing protein [Polyangiaceae bacterium]
MNQKRRSRAASRAFTLVELMVVVVIVGILATIGVASFRSRIFGSKSSDALAMIQSIRGAEERWRAENLTYLNVSQSGTWYPATPMARTKRAFYNAGTCGVPIPNNDDCRWKLLNPTPLGPTEFGFMVTAGAPGTPMTEPATEAKPSGWVTWPANGDYWFVIQAVADADGDGIYAKYVASSLRGDVYRENEGE